MESVPLQPADRAILDVECETIAGHTCKVIRLGAGAPGVEEIRARVAERIGSAPMLATRLGGDEGTLWWEPWPGFDVERRVRAIDVAPLTDDDLPAAVASLFEQRLDRTQPLWRMDVAPTADGGAVLVWRIHHALADGTAAMRFARELLWDADSSEQDRKIPASGEKSGPARVEHPDEARRRRHLTAFLEREFGESIRRSPFDGRIGTRRSVAFASTAMQPLHDAAKDLAGATLNDAVLSIVAGALRRWIEHHHGPLGGVRVRVPVSLHHEGDDAANRDSFFSLHLPLNQADPVERLRAVHRATASRKGQHDAERLEELSERLAGISPRMAGLAKRVEASPRNFALSVSNVPGPREPVRVLGAPVVSLHSLAEIGARHALRVAVVSVAGNLDFGLCADPAIVEDLGAMAAGIEVEAEALVRAARG